MAVATSNNRRVLVILGVGGVLIAMLAAFNLLKGGGDDSGDSGSAVAPAASQTAADSSPTTTPTPTPTTTPAAPSLPSESFDSFTNRNPFEPAIDVTPATTPESTSTGETVATDPPAPGATPVTPTPGTDQPAAGTTVALIEVFDQNGTTTAVVQVGSQQYTVAAGQVFATSYKVVSVSGTCGQFLYGDSPFTLCKGEQVIK